MFWLEERKDDCADLDIMQSAGVSLVEALSIAQAFKWLSCHFRLHWKEIIIHVMKEVF